MPAALKRGFYLGMLLAELLVISVFNRDAHVHDHADEIDPVHHCHLPVIMPIGDIRVEQRVMAVSCKGLLPCGIRQGPRPIDGWCSKSSKHPSIHYRHIRSRKASG